MINVAAKLGRKLRLGVIGGGPGSFIGPVHRGAALLHEQYEVTAGVLSSDAERSVAAGKALGIPRPYGTAAELFAGEGGHAQKIDLLAIMTPNNSHYELAVQALDLGIDVFCEKPLTNTLAEAEALAQRARQQGRLFAVAYAYTGYPMVRQARAMMASGQLGELRMVQGEYIQGHLATLTGPEKDGTNWHMQPEIAGPSLILGDIATHSYHLASYITGQEPQSLSADVISIVPGREAHDYCGILARYANQARGTFTVTQAAAGAVHGLRIRVFGSKGGLEWFQEQPDELIYRPMGAPEQRLLRGGPGLSAAANRATHIALGHPEGYTEAFANIYQDLAEHILARHQGVDPDPLVLWYPDINDGVSGVKFVEAALRSSQNNSGWQSLTGH
ncbi:MAG: Gfo/Idh/MocA family oxidoreductase [Thiolinea sp.]